MLIDAPTYDSSKKGGESTGPTGKKLSHDELANQLLASIGNIKR